MIAGLFLFLYEICAPKQKTLHHNLWKLVTKGSHRLSTIIPPMPVQQELETHNNEPINNSIDSINTKIANLEKEIYNLKQIINNLQQLLAEKQVQHPYQQAISQSSQTNNVTIPLEIVVGPEESPQKEKIIYPQTRYASVFDCVNPVGFKESRLYRTPENCCFIITIKSSSHAEFRLMEGAEVLQLVQSFQEVLKGGCDIDGNILQAKGIHTKSPGTLYLQNGTWILENKLKIQSI